MATHSDAHPRLLEAALTDRLRRMPVVVVTGARQTGKTTLVRRFPGAGARRYETLDSISTLDRARSAPEALVAGDGPLTIDEVQRAPDLLLAVKAETDRRRTRGRFLLTGSSNLLLLRGVSESLAGRAAHLVLRPMTEREKRGEPAPPVWPALLAADTPERALAALPASRTLDWRDAALRGGLPPAALAEDAGDRAVWFDAYVDTYLHRDVRDLAQIGDLSAFARFLRLAALRTGGLLNVADLSRDAAVPRTTALRWMSILEATFLVTLLPAFAGNATTRLIKSPKLYSLDTGLSLHLAGVADAAGIDRTQNVGAWLEQLVLNDLLVWRESEPRKPSVCYSRTASGREADFVVEQGRRMLPIEVKAARTVRVDDARELDALCAVSAGRAPFGLLLHDGPEAFRLTQTTIAAPVGAVL